MPSSAAKLNHCIRNHGCYLTIRLASPQNMDHHPCYTLHPYMDLKPFGISAAYTPLSTAAVSVAKSPGVPLRVPAVKPSIPHSIDSILSRADEKSPSPSPSPSPPAVRIRPFCVPGRSFEYGPSMPLYWPGLVHPPWRERFTGTYTCTLI